MRITPVAVSLLLILAGCSGGEVTQTPTPTGQEPAAGTPEPTESSTTTDTATPTERSTPTATPLPEEARNPWEKQPVTVAIVKEHDESRNFEPQVREALEFWQQNATNATSFGIRYRLIEDSEEADIIIRLVKDISACGFEADEETVGCAPRLTHIGAAEERTDVRIETGYDNESTITIIKHELGHTLGLDHNDEDSHWFMAAKISVGTFPQPDLDERDWKWNKNTLNVYADVDVAADHRHEKLREEIRQMVSTYNNYDHEKIPANATIQMVDDRARADIVVKIVEETPSGDYSDAEFWGIDPDGDHKLEYYSNVTIYIRDEYHDDAGEYAGFWMGWALYADSNRELPHPYRPENLGD